MRFRFRRWRARRAAACASRSSVAQTRNVQCLPFVRIGALAVGEIIATPFASASGDAASEPAVVSAPTIAITRGSPRKEAARLAAFSGLPPSSSTIKVADLQSSAARRAPRETASPHAAVGPDKPVNNPMTGGCGRVSCRAHASPRSKQRMTARRMLLIISFVAAACRAQTPPPVTNDPKPQHYEIRADRLPLPYDTPSSGNPPAVVGRPANAALHLPPGFKASVWASNLEEPRAMTSAPNGDVFVVGPAAGRIKAFRDANSDGVPESSYVFATDLNQPYGIAFRGNQLYVGNEDAVVRFAYVPGKPAAGEPQRV